jgi:hypothetical protein
VCSFIGTDRSGPVLKAFVYWYGWDRTVPGRNRLFGDRTVLKWIGMELSNHRVVPARLEPFVYSGPFQYWSGPVRTNKQTHPIRNVPCYLMGRSESGSLFKSFRNWALYHVLWLGIGIWWHNLLLYMDTFSRTNDNTSRYFILRCS